MATKLMGVFLSTTLDVILQTSSITTQRPSKNLGKDFMKLLTSIGVEDDQPDGRNTTKEYYVKKPERLYHDVTENRFCYNADEMDAYIGHLELVLDQSALQLAVYIKDGAKTRSRIAHLEQAAFHETHRINVVLDYCKPHLAQMWAATIVGKLLQCDFRDAKAELEKWLSRYGQKQEGDK